MAKKAAKSTDVVVTGVGRGMSEAEAEKTLHRLTRKTSKPKARKTAKASRGARLGERMGRAAIKRHQIEQRLLTEVDFGKGGARVVSVLQAGDLETVGQLCRSTPADLMTLQGFGPAMLTRVKLALRGLGLELAATPVGGVVDHVLHALGPAERELLKQSVADVGSAFDGFPEPSGWPIRTRSVLVSSSPVCGMDFGDAVRALKSGAHVGRAGWNGKGMHVYLEDAFAFPVVAGLFADRERSYDPCLVLFTAQGRHQPGWVASQADILATDWQIFDTTLPQAPGSATPARRSGGRPREKTGHTPGPERQNPEGACAAPTGGGALLVPPVADAPCGCTYADTPVFALCRFCRGTGKASTLDDDRVFAEDAARLSGTKIPSGGDS